MKVFKKRNWEILDRIDDLEIKLDEVKLLIKNSNYEREKRLEDMLVNTKAHKIAEYEEQIKLLRSQIESKDTVIDQQQKVVEKSNEKIAKADVLLKEANKQIKKLEKEIEKYKEKGIAIPKRVKPATPKKGQAIKETVRTVKN